jgi:hypothetical protein
VARTQRTAVGLSGVFGPEKKNGRIFRSARTGVTRQKGRLTSTILPAESALSSICLEQKLYRSGRLLTRKNCLKY